jgi:hypothetical protein
MVPGEHGEGPAPLLSAPQCPPAPPAEGELEHLRAENEDLSERLGEMADLMKDTMEENESLQRIMDAENLRLGYQKEVTRFRAHANTCQSHLRGVVNETNAYKRTAKYWMNKCLSLAKTIERADKMHQVDHDDSSFVATVQKTLKKVQKAMDAPPVQDPAPYPHLDEVSALVREPLPEAPDLFAGCEDSEAVDV